MVAGVSYHEIYQRFFARCASPALSPVLTARLPLLLWLQAFPVQKNAAFCLVVSGSTTDQFLCHIIAAAADRATRSVTFSQAPFLREMPFVFEKSATYSDLLCSHVSALCPRFDCGFSDL